MKKTINIEINGKKKNLKLPTNGQIIEMDAMRSSFGAALSGRGSDIVEAMIFFQNCWPESLKRNGLDKGDWLDKSPLDTIDFVTCYVAEIKPWIEGVYAELDEALAKAIADKEEVEEAVKLQAKS